VTSGRGSDEGSTPTPDPEGYASTVPDRIAEEVVEELHLKPPDADADTAEAPLPTMSEQIAVQLGGVRGLAESSIPVFAFVLLNFILTTDVFEMPVNDRQGLYWAIGGAVGTAVAIAGYRLLRREPIRHAVNGVIGIAIGAYLAARSGQAKDFYLPGILLTLGQSGALLISVLVRKPIIGYIWAIMANRGRHDWLESPRLHRTFQWLTVAWAVSLIVRGGTQGLLYLADLEHLLGAARIFLSWPIYAGMLALTVWAVRRQTRHPAPV
jgi:Protein of unknown function (DUF3159)